MSTHTKGPWAFKGTLFGEWHISSEYGVDGQKLLNGRQHVCCSPSASSKLNPEYFSMFMANARLITAAPDLLETLEQAAESLEAAEFFERAASARAVAAKARGES